MMVGNHYYSEADMMRMQRGAEERVKEMQQRARQTSREMDEELPPMPSFASNPNRNWRPNPNGRRGQNQNSNRNSGNNHDNSQPQPDRSEERQDIRPEAPRQESDVPPKELPAPDATTLVEDIIGKLGLESDTLLIVGLILILINQKADNTIILALAYLLF